MASTKKVNLSSTDDYLLVRRVEHAPPTSDTKETGYETVLVADPPKMGFSSVPGLIGSKTYVFRLTRTASATTNGSGTMLLAVQTGLLTNFLQSTQLSAMFSEFRYLKSKITFNRYVLTTPATNEVQAFVCGYDPVSTGASPALVDIVRAPGSKYVNAAATTPTLLVNKHVQKPLRPFSSILATGSGVDPMGTCGAWTYGVLVAAPVSTSIVGYLLEAWFEFRCPR